MREYLQHRAGVGAVDKVFSEFDSQVQRLEGAVQVIEADIARKTDAIQMLQARVLGLNLTKESATKLKHNILQLMGR